jgi:hypothetical protein
MLARGHDNGKNLARDISDRHSQAMYLDERTVAVYSALDSVTLLALLPALRYEADRTKDEADTFERVRLVIPEQVARVPHGMGETVITKDRRTEETAAPERERPTSDTELGRVLERLDSYRADLLAREKWIRGDLVRRGLLPEYPYWGER